MQTGEGGYWPLPSSQATTYLNPVPDDVVLPEECEFTVAFRDNYASQKFMATKFEYHEEDDSWNFYDKDEEVCFTVPRDIVRFVRSDNNG